MYSVNVPVPAEVHELARDLRPALTGFGRIRERGDQTLLLKRLPADDRREYLEAERRARTALEGAPSFEARVVGIDAFREPPAGSAPVLYLAVEGPGLHLLHERLVEEFGAITSMEGDVFVPHVTLARDGGPDLEPLVSRDIDPITWTVTELEFYDKNYGETISRIPLPN